MPTAPAFQKAYRELNRNQRQAVDAIEGPVIVTAGPGTGKTQVLTLRIANILRRTDTPPEAILALTFTEAAAANMRTRLAAVIGQSAYRVRITTFHAFCNDVIQQHPERFGELGGRVAASDADQVRILDALLSTLPLKRLVSWGDRFMFLGKIKSAIDDCKREGVTPAQFSAIVQEEVARIHGQPDLIHEKGAHKGKMKSVWRDALDHTERLAELATVYDAYQRELAARGVYDYNDMVMQVLAALERDEELRLMLQERALYILVDEHQDTNRAQNRVVELLAGFFERPNLFVVGDAQQAIFRFQGASLGNFDYFRTKYPQARLVALADNYRSTQAILNAAHALTGHGTPLHARADHPEAPVQIAAFSGPAAEEYFIATHIGARIAAGASPDQIAVICRDNADTAGPLAMLQKHGTACRVEAADDALADADIRKFLVLLRAVRNLGNDAALAEALHAGFLDIAPLDIYKLADTARRVHTSLWDAMRNAGHAVDVSLEHPERLTSLYANFSRWRRVATNVGLIEALETIARESGFVASLLSHAEGDAKMARLHALYEDARAMLVVRRDATLDHFLERLDLLAQHGMRLDSSQWGARSAVVLMTAHKSKGREFDYVYLVNAIEGKWGSRRTRDLRLPHAVYTLVEHSGPATGNDDGDERNLFYVALTRARRQCVISWSQHRADGKPNVASQFALALYPLAEHVHTLPYEEALAKRRDVLFTARRLPEPPLQDREYLQTLFRERGLTVSALNNYIECPWKFFYGLVRVPEAPNKYAVLGDGAAQALKAYFDRYARGEEPERAFLLDRFSAAMLHAPLPEADWREAGERGRALLAAWHDHYHGSWHRNILNECAIDGVTLADDISVRGRLDKIEILDASERVNVVDYKTGRVPSVNELHDHSETPKGNYRRQLVFYKLLLDRWQNGKYRMETGQLDFIQPDRSGKWRKETFVIGPTDVAELEQLISRVAHEIRSLAFWNRTCENRECRYCRLRAMMV